MALPPHIQAGERVVLFDGVCRLCNGWAKFLIRQDRERSFRLCSVQSAEGQAILAWFGLPIFCALPFMLGTWQLSFVDAVFESVSGLTTTGSTVVSGLDDSPPSLLLWRSVLQWIGGVGIIALSIAILPFLKVGGMQLFKMESSDTSSERLIARPNQLAIAIGSIV